MTVAPADVTTKVDGMCALADDPGGSKGPSTFPVGDEAISCPELSSIFMLVALGFTEKRMLHVVSLVLAASTSVVDFRSSPAHTLVAINATFNHVRGVLGLSGRDEFEGKHRHRSPSTTLLTHSFPSFSLTLHALSHPHPN